jgi:hypothetical protein
MSALLSERIVTSLSLPREVHETLREMALRRAIQRGTRINVSAVITDLTRDAAARQAAGNSAG